MKNIDIDVFNCKITQMCHLIRHLNIWDYDVLVLIVLLLPDDHISRQVLYIHVLVADSCVSF